ncbi:hypothetical protein [Novipirellula artificiosorum]|uniref:hypothetical protein n=1 Tax=Novipirellula artificiosorum TaxID=2528016 RepID=UPI0018CCE875|nr:hypothetical protein [Novipirellula artificiosorum]
MTFGLPVGSDRYPHFFVLESDGTFLQSQGTGELEKGKGYNEANFIGFLNAWTSEK